MIEEWTSSSEQQRTTLGRTITDRNWVDQFTKLKETWLLLKEESSKQAVGSSEDSHLASYSEKVDKAKSLRMKTLSFYTRYEELRPIHSTTSTTTTKKIFGTESTVTDQLRRASTASTQALSPTPTSPMGNGPKQLVHHGHLGEITPIPSLMLTI